MQAKAQNNLTRIAAVRGARRCGRRLSAQTGLESERRQYFLLPGRAVFGLRVFLTPTERALGTDRATPRLALPKPFTPILLPPLLRKISSKHHPFGGKGRRQVSRAAAAVRQQKNKTQNNLAFGDDDDSGAHSGSVRGQAGFFGAKGAGAPLFVCLFLPATPLTTHPIPPAGRTAAVVRLSTTTTRIQLPAALALLTHP